MLSIDLDLDPGLTPGHDVFRHRAVATAFVAIVLSLFGAAASAADLHRLRRGEPDQCVQGHRRRVRERPTPSTKVLFNYAASGALLQQIAKGAPVDVFASADQETMDQAEQQQLVEGRRRG